MVARQWSLEGQHAALRTWVCPRGLSGQEMGVGRKGYNLHIPEAAGLVKVMEWLDNRSQFLKETFP